MWLASSDDIPKLLLTFGSSPTLLIGEEIADWCAANIAALETQHCGPARGPTCGHLPGDHHLGMAAQSGWPPAALITFATTNVAWPSVRARSASDHVAARTAGSCDEPAPTVAGDAGEGSTKRGAPSFLIDTISRPCGPPTSRTSCRTGQYTAIDP